MLQRSIIQPITGTIMALTMPPTESASEAVPRCQPISAMIGFKNTPKVKASTGPLQTNKPVTEPPTTHQGLLNRMPKMSSRDAAGLDARVGGHPIASGSAGPMARARTPNVVGRGWAGVVYRAADRKGMADSGSRIEGQKGDRHRRHSRDRPRDGDIARGGGLRRRDLRAQSRTHRRGGRRARAHRRQGDR